MVKTIGKKEVETLLADGKATAPATPVEGEMYYNSTDKKYKYYNGSAWKEMGEVENYNDMTNDTVETSKFGVYTTTLSEQNDILSTVDDTGGVTIKQDLRDIEGTWMFIYGFALDDISEENKFCYSDADSSEGTQIIKMTTHDGTAGVWYGEGVAFKIGVKLDGDTLTYRYRGRGYSSGIDHHTPMVVTTDSTVDVTGTDPLYIQFTGLTHLFNVFLTNDRI